MNLRSDELTPCPFSRRTLWTTFLHHTHKPSPGIKLSLATSYGKNITLPLAKQAAIATSENRRHRRTMAAFSDLVTGWNHQNRSSTRPLIGVVLIRLVRLVILVRTRRCVYRIGRCWPPLLYRSNQAPEKWPLLYSIVPAAAETCRCHKPDSSAAGHPRQHTRPT